MNALGCTQTNASGRIVLCMQDVPSLANGYNLRNYWRNSQHNLSHGTRVHLIVHHEKKRERERKNETRKSYINFRRDETKKTYKNRERTQIRHTHTLYNLNLRVNLHGCSKHFTYFRLMFRL